MRPSEIPPSPQSSYPTLVGSIGMRADKIGMHQGGWSQPSLRCVWSVFANVLNIEAGEVHVFNRASSVLDS